MENVKFSVSMCVYDGDNAQWFQEAVNSVLKQTVKPTEIVLVVDGPVRDSLAGIIADFEKLDNFRVVRLPQNQGHGDARRTGLEECRYDLVALMDADDICLPDRFEKQLAVFAENPSLSIVGGQIAEFIDTQDNVIGKRIVAETDAAIKQYLKKRCPFNQMTVMFKKDDVQKVGGYRDWFCNEDYYLWLRMYLAGMSFANVSDILVNVRVGRDMYKRRGGWRYFKSEHRLQRFMLSEHVIGYGTFLNNVAKRFIVQMLLPNSIRGYVFQKFTRS